MGKCAIVDRYAMSRSLLITSSRGARRARQMVMKQRKRMKQCSPRAVPFRRRRIRIKQVLEAAPVDVIPERARCLIEYPLSELWQILLQPYSLLISARMATDLRLVGAVSHTPDQFGEVAFAFSEIMSKQHDTQGPGVLRAPGPLERKPLHVGI